MIERPSYSLLMSEGDPAGFKKWYQLPKGSKLLMSLTDLISSHQGSFVSSRVLFSANIRSMITARIQFSKCHRIKAKMYTINTFVFKEVLYGL